MTKLGFSLQSSYTVPMPEVLRLLRDIGFHAVSPLWQRGSQLDTAMEAAARCGLAIQSLHGPVRGIPSLWSRDRDCSAPLLQDFLDAADACARYKVPVLVIHSWTGLDYAFREAELFFDNFDVLVEHARQRGIRIAFENLEGPEYLDALMSRYRDVSSVGFCWDSGHQQCYTPNRDFLQQYGDRLMMTHLNDNFGITDPDGRLRGTDDLHLLPFDGTIDWSRVILQLQQATPQDLLNFEFKIRPKGDRCTHDLYSRLPLEDYLTAAYRSACRIAAAYDAADQIICNNR